MLRTVGAQYLLAGSLLLTACKRRDDLDEPEDAPKPHTEAAKKTKPLSSLFAGTEPATPPNVFGEVKLGGPLPPSTSWKPSLVDEPVPLVDFPKVRATASETFEAPLGRVRTLNLVFADKEEAETAIVTAWGPGDAVGAAVTRWFNPQRGIRADLEAHRLTFSTYLPAAKLLGSSPGLPFGFEKVPLLGALREDLAPYDLEPFEVTDLARGISLPPTEWSTTSMTVLVDAHGVGGRVRGYAFGIRYDERAAARDDIRALLLQKLGAPTSTKTVEGKETLGFDFPNATVGVTDDADSWFVEVDAVKKH